MWSVLVGWALISIVAVALIGVGVGVLSMNPPHYQIAQASFSIAAALLLGRSAWWIVFEQSDKVSIFQRITFTIIVFAAIGVLWEESVRWVNNLSQPGQSSLSNVSRSANQPTTEAKDEKSPTLLDLFKSDFSNTLRIGDTNGPAFNVQSPDGSKIEILRQIYMDFPARTKFVGFYIHRPVPPSLDFKADRTAAACLQLLRANAIQG